jgi:hypothetical protein
MTPAQIQQVLAEQKANRTIAEAKIAAAKKNNDWK